MQHGWEGHQAKRPICRSRICVCWLNGKIDYILKRFHLRDRNFPSFLVYHCLSLSVYVCVCVYNLYFIWLYLHISFNHQQVHTNSSCYSKLLTTYEYISVSAPRPFNSVRIMIMIMCECACVPDVFYTSKLSTCICIVHSRVFKLSFSPSPSVCECAILSLLYSHSHSPFLSHPFVRHTYFFFLSIFIVYMVLHRNPFIDLCWHTIWNHHTRVFHRQLFRI